MLRGLGLTLGEISVRGRVDVDLHHERELRIFFLYLDQARQNLFPSGTAEEVVVDQEQRRDSMVAARVAHPTHHRVGLARPHRAPHHVLDAAVRARERASARRVDCRHRGIEEARQVAIVDHRQLCVGDNGHDDIVLAGLGADSLGHRVSEFEFAAQEILDNLAPKIFRLAHDGRDTAAVEECARFGVAAHVEPAHHRFYALGDELKSQVAPARVLIGLDPGETNEKLDAVFGGFLLDGPYALRADDSIANFVPYDGLEIDIALGRITPVEPFVERFEDSERVVRLDAVTEEMDVAFVVVARRFDEVDSYGAAWLRFEHTVAERACVGAELQHFGRSYAAVSVAADNEI